MARKRAKKTSPSKDNRTRRGNRNNESKRSSQKNGKGGSNAAPQDNGHSILVQDELPWWHDLITSAVFSPLNGRQRAIFTNRTLRLDKVKAVGFDFDHTLGVYNCEALDSLAMKLVIERLIEHAGIDPNFVKNLPDPSFFRKGLTIDLELGNVLKTDRFGHVKRAYHGKTPLTQEDKRRFYSKMDVIPHVTQGKRFLQSDSAFAHPEVLIFAALAPTFGKGKCAKLWKTIRKHTDIIHRDGSLKKIITANPLEFIQPDRSTIALLQMLREGGKKVFLLTNSEWEYTRAMINPALGLGAQNGLDWLDLFDLVVVEARKPDYFNRPRKEEASSGTKKKRSHPSNGITVDGIAPGRVMRGGDLEQLEQSIGAAGPEILYVGDHIYADLITSKRKQSWRTMLIISELEEELKVQSMLPGTTDQLHNTDERRWATEREVQHWKSMEMALDRLPKGPHGALAQEFRKQCARHRKQASQALRQYIQQREKLRSRLSKVTNKYWGSLFRADNELTYYGRQLEDFACAYTSRATNLGLYPADHYFRSAMDYMPHELEALQ